MTAERRHEVEGEAVAAIDTTAPPNLRATRRANLSSNWRL